MTTMFEAFDSRPKPPWLQRWFEADPTIGVRTLQVRWLWLRCLGAIFFSAFYSLWFQIHGLIGPHGLLPATSYLPALRRLLGARGFWLVPSLLWIDAGDAALTTLVVAGLVASIALMLNLWPRLSIAVAMIAFLSFVAAAQDFSSYQSDGMLLEAAFLSLFFAPRGIRPRLGAHSPPSRASLFLLQYEWFRIYFESGMVKILSGEPQWRNFTAMDKYYENGPLPTWLGWHVQQWPHSFHAFTAAATLIVELFVVWLLFLPRKARLVCFAITTPLQIGIILTANYAFLNYLVLCLGVLLLGGGAAIETAATPKRSPLRVTMQRTAAVVLIIHFLTTTVMFLFPNFPTAVMLEPFRIANSYGLFAVMTPARYEIEFQGTRDGTTWIAYPFRYKPQDVRKAPGIYAPYQPRFDWNLWFASLGTWDQNRWVLNCEAALLENRKEVLALFAGNPFAAARPTAVRAVVWQYWFTTRRERAASGAWWRREDRGLYAPSATRAADGTVRFTVE